MAALVQSFPQQSSTVTMLQTRPTSASDPFQTGGQIQQQSRSAQISRNLYTTSIGAVGGGTYRGHTTALPVAPYAFTATPVLMNNANPLRQHPTMPHLRQENRTTSAPVVPLSQQITTNQSFGSRQRQVNPSPTASSSLDASYNSLLGVSKDDTSAIVQRLPQINTRPLSSIELGSKVSELTVPILPNPPKPSPDRYRRNNRKSEPDLQAAFGQTTGGSAPPSGSGMATIRHLYSPPAQHPQISSYRGSTTSPPVDTSILSQPTLVSKDDMILRRQNSSDLAKRYRRRSISSLEAKEYTGQFTDPQEERVTLEPKTYAAALSSPPVSDSQDARRSPVSQRPTSSHARNGSSESTTSSRTSSRPPSSKREAGVNVASVNPTALQATPIAKHEAKLVNIPPRGSSDANKRLTNPSPLSKPMTMSPDSPATKDSFSIAVQSRPSQLETAASTTPHVTIPESPAAQHLAALNKKDAKKEGKSSRLRRAFSFGSAAELRKASAENSHNNNLSAERAKLRKDRYHDEQEAEQAAIAQKQEAGGLGEGIYSGQGHFFTGSTDNLSISSTASSASVMIRKMGKGMKKSTRSLVGLFRPKSVVGVPAMDSGVPEPSVAQVSMVTVEAEREKVNVNLDPHDQPGGGTGYPKLERNSLDAASVAAVEPSFSEESAQPRRSIVGGEKERAEVLAAVKKGILKRNGTSSGQSSPVQRPVDSKNAGYTLPQIPSFTDSPTSSAPSTPGDDHPSHSGHRRTESVTIEGEDYFMSIARFANSDTKSMPGTPRSIAVRNISFSPRIQFHDTWTSGEYDRRGEIATCNRLTPMLAQQIKEELNSFKMEMEVHQSSKCFTHFF